MENDFRRSFKRIEPGKMFVSVSWAINPTQSCMVRGKVLDISRSGMAIELYTKKKIDFHEISKVDIKFESADETIEKVITNAIKTRNWDNEYSFGEEIGLAVRFDSILNEDDSRIVIGLTKNERLDAQKEIAKTDICNLSAYRGSLSECQMKLLEICFTIGVGLASLYFSLSFINQTNQFPGIFFWRTMIAALCGVVAVCCALLFVQKSISLQRVDSFLSLIKEYYIIGSFPREYKGWEIESRKFRNVLNSKSCTNCKLTIDRKCGCLTNEERKDKIGGIKFNMPNSDFFTFLAFSIFFGMIFLSIFAIGYSFKVYNLIEIKKYVITSSIITSVIVALFILVAIELHNFRKGKYCFTQLRRNWLDIMNRCSERGC
jgi:hypothetical protein